jgi:hypothetical protein
MNIKEIFGKGESKKSDVLTEGLLEAKVMIGELAAIDNVTIFTENVLKIRDSIINSPEGLTQRDLFWQFTEELAIYGKEHNGGIKFITNRNLVRDNLDQLDKWLAQRKGCRINSEKTKNLEQQKEQVAQWRRAFYL